MVEGYPASLKTYRGLNDKAAELGTRKSAAPGVSKVLLAYIFSFGYNVSGQEPSAAYIDPADFFIFCGTLPHLSIHGIIPPYQVELFILTKTIKDFGGKLPEGSLLIGNRTRKCAAPAGKFVNTEKLNPFELHKGIRLSGG